MANNESDDSTETDNVTSVTFGPANAPYWKFRLAQAVFWVVRLSPLTPVIKHLPGAKRAGEWAFRVTVLSRDTWEDTPHE
ncbi:hypothetical protein [Salinibaculum rarum]|uniref:hypothetical protein n=1 Tax=Salinibaculum rarum TaxID=3058903 RepID=UPI0026604C8C|nr:hypothetical protein [Salinibaculum sp. KK48]